MGNSHLSQLALRRRLSALGARRAAVSLAVPVRLGATARRGARGRHAARDRLHQLQAVFLDGERPHDGHRRRHRRGPRQVDRRQARLCSICAPTTTSTTICATASGEARVVRRRAGRRDDARALRQGDRGEERSRRADRALSHRRPSAGSRPRQGRAGARSLAVPAREGRGRRRHARRHRHDLRLRPEGAAQRRAFPRHRARGGRRSRRARSPASTARRRRCSRLRARARGPTRSSIPRRASSRNGSSAWRCAATRRIWAKRSSAEMRRLAASGELKQIFARYGVDWRAPDATP